MSLINLFGSLVEEFGKILILGSNTFGNLDNDSTALQIELLALTKIEVLAPVHVANEIPPLIVHHDALVEGVKLEASILPSLLFALQVRSK